MNELIQLQQQFQDFLLNGKTEIISSVLSTSEVSVEQRLAIYRDAYNLRLIESLSTSFPMLHSYLGTEAFQKMCRNFIEANPSHYRSIRWYGDVMPSFLGNYYKKTYAFLAELADFEWKMTLAFDAPDASIVTLDEMAAVSPNSWVTLSFVLHPSVQRVNYFWNSLALWRALIDDEELPSLKEEKQPCSWLLWRSSDYLIQYYSLAKEEAWMIDGVQQGFSFAVLCEGLCEWIAADQVAMTAASYLKNWISKGIIAALNVA